MFSICQLKFLSFRLDAMVQPGEMINKLCKSHVLFVFLWQTPGYGPDY